MSGTTDPNANTLANLAAGLFVTGPATGVTVLEDGAGGVFGRGALLANAFDSDPTAVLEIQVDSAGLPPGVVYNHVPGFTTVSTISYYGFSQIISVPTVDTLTLDPSNAAYQSLAAGEEMDVVANYTVSDGTNAVQAQAIFHVVGTNDAPVVAGPVVGAALESDAPVTIGAFGNASDADHGAVLTVVAAPPLGVEVENFINAAGVAEGAAPAPPPILAFDPAGLPAGVSFDAATNSFSFDPSDAAYRGLTRGQTATIAVNYGVSDGTVATAASIVFTVTGINHAPTVSGPVDGGPVYEGSGLATYNLQTLLSTTTDADPNDKLSVTIDPNDLPEGVSFVSTAERVVPGYTIPGFVIPAHPFTGGGWKGYIVPEQVVPDVVVPDTIIPATTDLSLDTSDARFDSLAEGETRDIVVHYKVGDGLASVDAEAVFTVTGTNDAPVVVGPVAVAADEDGGSVTVGAFANAFDVDRGAVLSIVAAPRAVALPTPGSIVGDDAKIEAELEAATAAAGAAVASTPFDPSTLPAGVTFDAATASFTLDPSDAAFQSLAQGQSTTVTVHYGVSDGIVATAASVVYTVTGTNDAPVVSGPVTAPYSPPSAAGEVLDTPNVSPDIYNRATLLSTATDVDADAHLAISVDTTQLPAGVSYVHADAYSYDTLVDFFWYGIHTWIPTTISVPEVDTLTMDETNPAYASLAQGEVLDVTVNFGVTDGIATTAAQAIFHVTGVNDAPVVSGPVAAVATEDGASVTVNGLANATDVDHGSVLSIVAAPVEAPADKGLGSPDDLLATVPPAIQPLDLATLPAGVIFDAASNSFTIDPSNAAYQYLAQGQTASVTVNYGVTDGMVVTAASTVFALTGTNDIPVVSGPATGVAVHEDGSAGVFNHAMLVAHATDVDLADKLDVQIVDADLPAGVVYHHTPGYTTSVGISTTYYGAVTSYVDVQVAPVDTLTIEPGNAAYQSLAEGEELDVVVNYNVTDGIASVATQAIFQVIGTNDAPIVAGALTAAATEDGAAVVVNGLSNATDIDRGAVLRVVAAPPPASAVEVNVSAAGIAETATVPPPILPFDAATLPAGVTFDAATDSFAIDPTNAAFQSLGQGQTRIVTVNFGVSDGMANTAASVSFTVTGTNDAPIVAGPLSVAVTAVAAGAVPTTTISTLVTSDGHGSLHDALSVQAEASAASLGLTAAQISNSVDMLANASDVDNGDVLSIVDLDPLPAGISHTQTAGYYTPSTVYYGAPIYHPGFDLLTIDPSNPAFRSLAAGDTQTIVVNYGVTDGHTTTAASASFTIVGVNDAPVVPNPVATATEDGASASIALMSTASDPDRGSVVSLASVDSILPAGISYDAATQTVSLDATNAVFQSLGQGQIGTYAVNFNVTDGQLVTPSSAIFTVVGVNDAPIVVAPMVGTANEDGAIANIDPMLSVTDVDSPTLTVVGLPATLPAGVTFNAGSQKFFLDPSNAAYQSLSLNETKTVSIAFGISDGYATVPATAVFTVTGKNDAPVVSGVLTGGTVTGQSAPLTLNLLAKATDIDHLDVLSVNQSGGNKVVATVSSGTWTAPVAFTVTNNQLAIDPNQFAKLALGSSVGLTFNYQVTDGNPGGSVAASANLTVQGTYVPPAPPTGVSVSPLPGQVAKAQGGSAITAKTPIATFAQIGGSATDAYSFALSGTGAGTAFALATTANVATLSSGNGGAAGAAGGQLYALNVTATDTTTGLSAPASAVDVVVGLGKGSNTVNLAAIPGIAPAAPTFIYDLGGADVINGAGMTGKLFISSGQGADTMTGGSGPNDYLYGSANDSSQTAMDIITNFHAASDMLDFTGLGGKALSVGALASNATTVAGNTIGWQTSGGNTFVYVNTGGNSAALSAAAMKIELMGTVPLTAGNIAHL